MPSITEEVFNKYLLGDTEDGVEEVGSLIIHKVIPHVDTETEPMTHSRKQVHPSFDERETRAQPCLTLPCLISVFVRPHCSAQPQCRWRTLGFLEVGDLPKVTLRGC